MEQVYSYNPGARTGWLLADMRRKMWWYH